MAATIHTCLITQQPEIWQHLISQLSHLNHEIDIVDDWPTPQNSPSNFSYSLLLIDGIDKTSEQLLQKKDITNLNHDDSLKVLLSNHESSDVNLNEVDAISLDDIWTTPIESHISIRRLEAITRQLTKQQKLREQWSEAVQMKAHLESERKSAKSIFDNLSKLGNLDHPALNYYISPVSLFNGDVLLAATDPNDNLYVLLGDFTGHGLPAAVGALPTAQIFYTMSHKGLDLDIILSEINKHLYLALPDNIFCACSAFKINFDTNSIIWANSGLPPVLICNSDGLLINEYKSQQLPLAIIEPNSFTCNLRTEKLAKGDRILTYSDGIIEAQNPNGDFFGMSRLKDLYQGQYKDNDLVEHTMSAVAQFNCHKNSDDTTFLCMTII